MPSIPKNLVAIDIETASPHKTPGRDDFRDTSYFEPVAIGVGHQPDPDSAVETEVIFRQGGWEPAATNDLLQRLEAWCGECDPEAVLTYNGERFDKIHLKGWAEQVAEEGFWPDAHERVGALFSNHIDLLPLAVDRHQDRLESWQNYVSLEHLCEWEEIDVPETIYEDYDIGSLTEQETIDAPHVTNVHIGEVLGEAYITHVMKDSTETDEFRELERLLRHYTQADIEPLFELARRFGNSE